MILIVGLGNPGKKYQKTRHNIGRLVVSSWQKIAKFPSFKLKKKFQSLISEGDFTGKKIILALPETFMNFSGKSVKALISYYKTTRPGLVVIHDDIDLPLGKIRASKGKGSAGHKGVQSIINELGQTKDFIRFRIGIRPASSIKYQVLSRNLEEFVLEKFSKGEKKIVKEVVKRMVDVIETVLKEGLEKTMNRFNE